VATGASFTQPLGASFAQTSAATNVSGYKANSAKITGTGMVARFAPIKGVTPTGALDRRLWLPAMLDPYTIDETAQHNEYDTISGGHFSQPAQGDQNARQFRTLTIQAITVEFDAPWLVATGQDPEWVRSRLAEILRFKKPVQLTVTFNPHRGHPGPETEMYCTFRQLTQEVRNGEIETRYITIDLSEWRDPSTQRRGSAPTSRKKGVNLPTTHALTAKDTLSSLSFDYYGSYSFWRVIRDANGISKRFGQKTPLVSLPGRWKVGLKIKIPALGAKLSFPSGARLTT
jgi:hypothetical protein